MPPDSIKGHLGKCYKSIQFWVILGQMPCKLLAFAGYTTRKPDTQRSWQPRNLWLEKGNKPAWKCGSDSWLLISEEVLKTEKNCLRDLCSYWSCISWKYCGTHIAAFPPMLSTPAVALYSLPGDSYNKFQVAKEQGETHPEVKSWCFQLPAP